MEYILERKKIKHLYLKIKAQKLYVIAPMQMDVEKIEQFVFSKQNWILKHLEFQKKHALKYVIHEEVRIFGKYYQLVESDTFAIKDSKIYCTKEVLNRYLRKTLENKIKIYFHKYCEIMKEYFDIPKIKFSYLKGKWGVCYPKKKEVGFSYHLVHCNESFIEYVVVHELAHLVYPNHAKQFYYFIEKYLPNYKQIVQHEKQSI